MKDRLNALEIALKNESAEREFYSKHAEKTRNLFGKRLFERLAAEELEHYVKLKTLHEGWEKEGRWPETVPLSVEGTQVKALIQGMKQDVAEMTAGNEDDLKAVRTALGFEATGQAFYGKLRDESKDPREKAFFNLLARMEQEHLLSLKETEEFLVDPAAWYRRKDKSGWLDGGA